MHQDKHAKLGEAGLLQVVMGVAMRFAVSTDDVVHAAQGRPGPAGAKSAVASLDPDQRKQLAALAWPWTCPGCQGLADDLVVCTVCGVKGCAACQVPGACPSCRRAAAEKTVADERRADELRRTQAERDRGAQEAAEASARIQREAAELARVAAERARAEERRLLEEQRAQGAAGPAGGPSASTP